MILPPTQQLVSCSFRHSDQVEFQELWCGPELGEKARVLVVCGSGREVEHECPISLLEDGNREHNTHFSPMESLIFSVCFLRGPSF